MWSTTVRPTKRTALVAFALLWCAANAESAPARGASCFRARPAVTPDWNISGAFAPNGDLLLVDSFNEEILTYDSTGRLKGPLPLGGQLENFFPSLIKKRGEGLVLETAVARFAFLDSRLSPARTRDALRMASIVSPRLYSFVGWDFAGDDMITFSDFEDANGVSKSGFIRFPFYAGKPISVLHEVPRFGNVHNSIRLGHPYIATIGGTAYILELNQVPEIYRNRPGTREWHKLAIKLPVGSPKLPRFFYPADYPGVMAAVKRSSMPVGLYSSGKNLVVFSRRASPSGTQWLLTLIDPEKEQTVWTKRLDLDAEHVTVVPGPRNWAFVEKGPIKDTDYQKPHSVLFVPTVAIESPLKDQRLCSTE